MAEKPPKAKRPAKPKDREASPRHVGKKANNPRTVRDLLKDVPDQNEQTAILIRLGDPGVADEATVLIGGALLEVALKNAIILHFRSGLPEKEISRLFDIESTGPLSTFAAKIKIAYALGIGGERTRDDLDSIRLTRNLFAHTPRHVSFSDPEVAAECAKLYMVQNASLLSLAGLNIKQRFVYAVFQYHYGLRLYSPNHPDPFPWAPQLP